MFEEAKDIHASQIARIHIDELRGDFLPSLGFNFLKTFYQGIIGKNGIWSFVYIDKGEIGGFVIGTRDINDLFKEALKANFFRLTFFVGIQLILNPFLIKYVLETYLYPKKDAGPKAELVVIAVLKKFQGKGIGKKLISKLEKVFRKDGIKIYKLTVHKYKTATKFYEHLKFNKIGEFSLYDKIWCIYAKKI